MRSNSSLSRTRTLSLSLSLSLFPLFAPNNDILGLHNQPVFIPMSPPNFPQLPLISLFIIFFTFFNSPVFSSPLSTIAVSHIANLTLVCALIPSSANLFDLNCTSFPNGNTHYYPAGINPYTAIAAGDGFLCALTSQFSSNTSTMRWWDFADNPHKNSIPDAKRVYIGPALSQLSAGDSHVCGVMKGSDTVNCWRWPQLDVPAGLKPAELAVGADFVCGLLDTGVIKCFGNESSVVGNEPNGSYTALAAGTSHACGISVNGRLNCWGLGAPVFATTLPSIDSMALGNNRTCVLDSDAKVHCRGENLEIPHGLVGVPFVAIQARGDAFCGVLMTNFSLVCWGNQAFHPNHVVYKQVLPGACATSCPCLPLAGTGNLCGNGESVCRPCPLKLKLNTNSTTVTDHQSNSSHERRKLIFIILGAVGFVIGLIAVAGFLFFRFKLKNGRIHDSGRLRGANSGGGPSVRPRTEPCMDSHLSQLFNMGHNITVEEFPIKALLAITNGFSDEHKIGSGSFGSVYHAKLDDGRTVAIKRAGSSTSASTSRARTPNLGETRQKNKENAFCAELAHLSRVNHKNLVRLFGYCKHGSERILIYEFMTNGTLHDLLHKSDQQLGSPLGSWAARIRVALDAARGIEYLHTYAVPPIIHRDIKSSNILLDEHWTAKVSDFGLSLMNPGSADDSGPNVPLYTAGTVGYMDPEYYRLQHLTAKSDVYSFGVVLLEILSGCRVIQRYDESGTPKNVVEFAVPHIVHDDIHRVLDSRLAPPTPSEIEAVAYVGYLAADCVSPEGRDRPTMTEIVSGLERALAAISGPEAGPGPSSFSRSSTSRSWS